MSTTIQIQEETRDKIKSFGLKGETYDDIINRLFEKAVEQQLKEFLLSSDKMIPIDEAIEKSNKKWQK